MAKATDNVSVNGYSSTVRKILSVDTDGKPLSPDYNRFTDYDTLVTAQDLTDTYADLGSEIDVRGYTKLGVFVSAVVNDSENVVLEGKGKLALGDTRLFPLNNGGVETLWTTGATDFNRYYEFDVSAIPVIQLQVIAGTVGTTAGNLTIFITKAWK